MNHVVVYSKQMCPSCTQAKTLLQQKGVDFEQIKIDDEPERKQEMIHLSGGRQTVPQIFINDEHIGGFDELWELEKQGKLDQKLAK
jgi:glutaredoxin 3